MSERRRLTIIDGDQTLEVVAPFGASVADLVVSLNLGDTHQNNTVLSTRGQGVDPQTQTEDLQDGDVLVLLQTGEVAESSPSRSSRTQTTRDRPGNSWWLLGVSGALSSGLALSNPDILVRHALQWVPALLVIVAVMSSLVWVRREGKPGMRHSATIAPYIGPGLLVFAAAAMAVPQTVTHPGASAGQQVSVVAGLIALTTLTSLTAYLAPRLEIKARLGTVAVIFAVVTLIWLAVLLCNLPAAAAAAVILGAAPVALRALPSFLLDVRPGYLVDMKRFMLLRWTVRQDIPDGEGALLESDVRNLVDESNGRLTTGTLLISVLSAASAVASLPQAGRGALESIAWTVMCICAFVALSLSARRASNSLLRWAPRGAAAVVLAALFWVLARTAGTGTDLLVAAIVLLGSFGVVSLLVPVHRGMRTLFWSRMGDIAETTAAAFTFPAALLAAGTIDLVRGFMA